MAFYGGGMGGGYPSGGYSVSPGYPTGGGERRYASTTAAPQQSYQSYGGQSVYADTRHTRPSAAAGSYGYHQAPTAQRVYTQAEPARGYPSTASSYTSSSGPQVRREYVSQAAPAGYTSVSSVGSGYGTTGGVRREYVSSVRPGGVGMAAGATRPSSSTTSTTYRYADDPTVTRYQSTEAAPTRMPTAAGGTTTTTYQRAAPQSTTSYTRTAAGPTTATTVDPSVYRTYQRTPATTQRTTTTAAAEPAYQTYQRASPATTGGERVVRRVYEREPAPQPHGMSAAAATTAASPPRRSEPVVEEIVEIGGGGRSAATPVATLGEDDVIDLERDKVWDGLFDAQAKEEEQMMQYMETQGQRLMLTAGPQQMQQFSDQMEQQFNDRVEQVSAPHLQKVFAEFARRNRGTSITREEFTELMKCFITAGHRKGNEEAESSLQEMAMGGAQMGLPPELMGMIAGIAGQVSKGIQDGMHDKMLKNYENIAAAVWAKFTKQGDQSVGRGEFQTNFMKYTDTVMEEGFKQLAESGGLDDVMPPVGIMMVDLGGGGMDGLMGMMGGMGDGPLMIGGPSGYEGDMMYAQQPPQRHHQHPSAGGGYVGGGMGGGMGGMGGGMAMGGGMGSMGGGGMGYGGGYPQQHQQQQYGGGGGYPRGMQGGYGW